MPQIAVSLGSNVNPEFHLKTAIFLLRPFFKQLLISPVYETEPVAFGGQNFLNIVFGGEVELNLEQTLSLLKAIEKQYQRNRQKQNKTQITLDLDLLFYDDLVCQQPVVLPRAEILNNAFVLKPLADVYADKNHPQNGQSYAQLWQNFNNPNQKFWKIDFNWNNK
ncbi:2-amino-4-hydroxy-6-hydroxymethyldihydropteridine diphosphokinase [Catenovulum sp. 2E275]|uniref:2-amino-4-hydroxy-6- hydroxymethyldihydropteridine diphosphokinase n=1 Tax=Catenovulum sp. 2E275 TaxID=2980497 RepID=UPI0021CFC364|nr:2-amino-4-hydroxy-6-hydroxymethyldihydropteridine diphosphokinase [Catenovulum sp. 2E275]MCU4674858.1 2-amino-4-hydroxy-6-hydroxymethyldihydropteridine diphosphokinase [Catenovulum sp. 2E275]